LLFNSTLFSQGSVCEDSDPVCSDDTYDFNAGVDEPDPPGIYDYGCLITQPNPAWFFFRIEETGDITFDIVGTPNTVQGNLDIDFVCWGPFETQTVVCGNDDYLTSENIVDCSYSPNSEETVNIPNAVEGEYYVLLITNYENDPGTINLEQTSGNGATDCLIVDVNVETNSPVCKGDTVT
jgi:hypothetical protein